MAKLAMGQMDNLIYGIVTAGCICVVFLIILTITYCYNRNNPDTKRRQQTGRDWSIHSTASIG
jgi:hypothetical protein